MIFENKNYPDIIRKSGIYIFHLKWIIFPSFVLILCFCFFLELYWTIHRQAPSWSASSGATCVYTCSWSQWDIDSLYLDGKTSTANSPFFVGRNMINSSLLVEIHVGCTKSVVGATQ